MKPRIRIIATALCATFAVCAQTATQEQQEHKSVHFSRYTIKDLGTLGGLAGAAFGINSSGHVSGQGALAGNATEHAFLYRNGRKMDLGTVGGPRLNSTVGTLNDRDEVSVIAETTAIDPLQENFCGFFTNHSCVGAVWKQGRLTPLPTLGGNNAFAVSVNNRGELVGYAENGMRDSTCPSPQKLDFEAVTWGPNGDIHELRPLKGDTVGFALGVNNRGDVAGGSGTCSEHSAFPLIGGPHAILWENGIPRDLGSLGGTLISVAAAVNDRREMPADPTSPTTKRFIASSGLSPEAWKTWARWDRTSLASLQPSINAGRWSVHLAMSIRPRRKRPRTAGRTSGRTGKWWT